MGFLHREEAILLFSDKVQALNARLLEASKQLVTACTLTVTARGMLDPKVLAYLLLCRTISNFEGMLLLSEVSLSCRGAEAGAVLRGELVPGWRLTRARRGICRQDEGR